MINMVLVESPRDDYDDPLRTLALVDFDNMLAGGQFSNRICWSTYGSYWGAEWKEGMKVLKRKE